MPLPSHAENDQLSLDRVTIVSVNGRDPERSVLAIRHSSTFLHFAESLLITNRDLSLPGIRTVNVGGLSSIREYNHFMVKELHRHVQTDFCLIVQPDGFVVNPWLWTDFYLHYDYIGAPWNMICSLEALMKSGKATQSNVSIQVGNGGFSLRSRRFLEASAQLEYENPDLEEDCFLTVKNRELLEAEGMRFAPVELARQFSLETCYDGRSSLGNHFGFHGRFPHFAGYLAITHPEG
jgi:hypothetical protein